MPDSFRRGQNPKSQANLTSHKGRPKVADEWGEDPVKYTTTLTPTAKKELSNVVKAKGFRSIPDFLEHVARQLIDIPPKAKD